MSPGAKKRALGWLRAGVAIALLGFGAKYLVPWHDQLVAVRGSRTAKVSGTIGGSWRGDTARFQAEPGAAVDPIWPESIAKGIASGSEFEVVRTVESGPGPAPGEENASRIDWKPGMLRVFREVDPRGLALAFLLILVGCIVAITRWWRLLAVAGCATRWSSAFRLSFLGLFFNIVLPGGITGGDVIKAVLVVREHPERRADAFVSVVLDRAIGLLVLMGLAAVVVLASGDRFAELRLAVVGAFLAALIGLWVLLHPGPRRWLRLSALLERLPQKERLKSIDRALQIYSAHPVELALAVLLSVLNHICIGGAICVLGRAFGDDLSFLEYLGVAAIANTISSVPGAPAGWGVGEFAFGWLFHLLGSPSTLGVAVSVAYRLLSMLLGFAGGFFLLLPGGRRIREQIDEEGPKPD